MVLVVWVVVRKGKQGVMVETNRGRGRWWWWGELGSGGGGDGEVAKIMVAVVEWYGRWQGYGVRVWGSEDW